MPPLSQTFLWNGAYQTQAQVYHSLFLIVMYLLLLIFFLLLRFFILLTQVTNKYYCPFKAESFTVSTKTPRFSTECIYVCWYDSQKRQRLFIYIYINNIKQFVFL
jgi:hypothetical protein